jgi:two-component system sensor histidine kinase VicK
MKQIQPEKIHKQSSLSRIVFISTVSFLLPLFGFLALLGSPLGGQIYQNDILHLVIMAIMCPVAFYVSFRAYLGFKDSRDTRLFFVALAFYVFGFVFLLHAVVAPVFNFPEVVFDIFEHYGLFLGVIIFLFILFVPIKPEKLYIHKSKVLFFSALLLLLATLAVIVYPPLTQLLERGIDIFTGATAGLFLILVVLLIQKYKNTKNVLLVYLIAGFSILVNVGIIPFFYNEWNVLWWYFHLVSLIGFVVILVGVSGGKRREKDFSGMLGNTPFFSKISTKLIVFIITLSLVSLSGFGYFSFGKYRQSLEEQVLDDLILIAETQEGQLLVYLEALKIRTVDFSSDGFIRDATSDIINNPDDAKAIEMLNQHLIINKMALDETILGINIISADGFVIASTDSTEIGKDERDEDCFIKTMELHYGKARINDILLSINFGTNQHTIIISSLLTDKVNGEKIGVIVNYFSTEMIDRVLSGQYQVTLGALTGLEGRRETIDIYLVNKDRLMISASRFFGDDVFLKQVVNTEPIEKCLISQEEISGKWLDYRNVPVFGASMCLVNFFNWTLMVEIDESEVIRPIIALRSVMFGAGAVLVFIIVLIGLYFSRRITHPIRALSELTKEISRGNYSIKVPIKSKDELGALAYNFNTMAEAIKESKKKIDDSLKLVKDQKKKVENQQNAILNILEDVEEEKNKATLEEEKVSSILRNVGDGVFVVDSNRNIIVFNSKAEEISGFERLEVIGKRYDTILKFIDEKDETKINSRFIEEVINTGKNKGMPPNTILIRKDGSKVPVADGAAPLKDGRGNVIGCIVVFRDMTKEREVDRAKNEFISLASHQLRAPMTGIQWVVERFLKKETNLSERGKDYLKDIHTSSIRLSELVDSLLNVARIESAGGIAVVPEKLDLIKFFEDYIGELAPLLEKKNLTLEFKDCPKSLEIVSDPRVLRNVLQSIVSNAIEYTPEGGSIYISVEKDNNVVIKIKDTGIGIPANEQSKMFEKFHRAENAKVMKTGGTGLGLYIAKKAIEALGGKIDFTSQQDKGTTFRIEFPIEVEAKGGGKELL